MTWLYLLGMLLSGHYLWKRAHGQWSERWLAPKERQWMHDLMMVICFFTMLIAVVLSILF